MRVAASTCQDDISWDRLGHAATIRSALSRWRHGFEPRWDCSFGIAGQGRGAFLQDELNPVSEPKGHANFVELARGHRQHRRYGVVSGNFETVSVQHHEHDEACPCEPLVAVDQRVVSGDPHGEDRGLVDELRVEVLISEGGLGSVER